FESIAVNFHIPMFFTKQYAMLVVVNIRRILQIPVFSEQWYLYDPVIGPCRMSGSAYISFVFYTKQAFWIIQVPFHRLFPFNLFRVLFWFGQVNGDIQFT